MYRQAIEKSNKAAKKKLSKEILKSHNTNRKDHPVETYTKETLRQAAASGADVGTGVLAGASDMIDQYKQTRDIKDSKGDWEDTLKDWKKGTKKFADAQGEPKGYVQSLVREAGLDAVNAIPYVGTGIGALARYGTGLEEQREALLEQGYSSKEVEKLLNRGKALTSAGIGTVMGKFESKSLEKAGDAFSSARKASADLKKSKEIKEMTLKEKIAARDYKNKENRHLSDKALKEKRNKLMKESVKNSAKHVAEYEASSLADDAQKNISTMTPKDLDELAKNPGKTVKEGVKGLLADRYSEGL